MTKPVSKDSREKTLKLLDEPIPNDSIQKEFELYHANNPHVYKFLVHYATKAVNELRKQGVEEPQYSISAVIERVRWHINFEVKGYKDFKIDNDYRSRYARLIMRTVPKLRGVFNLRRIHSTALPSTQEIAKHATANLKERNRDGQRQIESEG